MKPIFILLASIFFLEANSAFAQSSDTIEIRKNVFYQNGQRLKPKQVLEITNANPEAYLVMKKAKSAYDVGSIFGFVGGALIGWPLGTLVAGGDPNWALFGIGAGLVVVAIPFNTSYIKNSKQAVRVFNAGLH